MAEVPAVVDPAKSFVQVDGDRITLRKDLPLVLSSTSRTASASLKVGDVLQFEVLRPVKAGDVVLIPRGAMAQATVSDVANAGRLGKAGRLELTFTSVQLITGENVALTGVANFGGGSKFKNDAGNLGLIYAAGALFVGKGQEAVVPKGVHLPARVNENLVVSLAAVQAKQPVPVPPRTDVAHLFIFRDADPELSWIPMTFACGEARYRLLGDTAVHLELPPGEYWLRVGASTQKKLSKANADDLLHIQLAGGASYYATSKFDGRKKFFVANVAPAVGEEQVIGTVIVWDYPLASQSNNNLQALQARPSQ